MTDTPDDERVGYGRPPKSGQFKPGQSGNPKGRPKGKPSLDDVVQKVLSRKIRMTENGTEKRVSALEAMLTVVAKRALRGDLKAADVLFKLSARASSAGGDGNTAPDGTEPTAEDNKAALQELFRQLDLDPEHFAEELNDDTSE